MPQPIRQDNNLGQRKSLFVRLFRDARPSDSLSQCGVPHRVTLLRAGINSRPELHTATKDQRIAFHLLHDRCRSRIQNCYHCPVCNVTVERDDRVRGYEFAKDQYVELSEAELESLETESSNNIELKEFIPMSKIDPVYFESAYYVKLWKLKCPPSEHDLVFATVIGGFVHRSNANDVLKDIIARAQVKQPGSFHVLRHIFASLLLSKGKTSPRLAGYWGIRIVASCCGSPVTLFRRKTDTMQELASSILSEMK